MSFGDFLVCLCTEKLSMCQTKIDSFFLGRNKEFWIGLNDLAKEGWFTWISDYSTVAYTDWHPGNPNNYRGNEDCCEIHGFHWNDDNCARPYCFICEKQAN